MAGVLTFSMVPGSVCSGGGHANFVSKIDGAEIETRRVAIATAGDVDWNDAAVNALWVKFVAENTLISAIDLRDKLENLSGDIEGLVDRRGRLIP